MECRIVSAALTQCKGGLLLRSSHLPALPRCFEEGYTEIGSINSKLFVGL